jgi:hypothetical protein
MLSATTPDEREITVSDQMDARTQAVLDRYVAHRALTDLAADVGFTYRSMITADAVDQMMTNHIGASAASSALLRANYHADDVHDAVERVALITRKSIKANPVRPALLADQLAFHLLRAVADVERAVSTAQDKMDGAARVGHSARAVDA